MVMIATLGVGLGIGLAILLTLIHVSNEEEDELRDGDVCGFLYDENDYF